MTTAVHLDPRVQITFATKNPDATFWIELEYPVDTIPQALLDDLAKIGFAPDGLTQIPVTEKVEFLSNPEGGSIMKRLGYDVQEITLTKKGTSMFGGWNAEQKRTNLAQARRVLRAHGYPKVETWEKHIKI